MNSISKKYNIHPPINDDLSHIFVDHNELVSKLLYNRGIKNKEDIEKFLYPSYEKDIYDPFLIKDMDKACDRIIKAIKNNEKIVVYGDYDCDGIPASTIMNEFFEKIGYQNHSVYIPHRHDEGFGLHKEAIDEFGKDGVNLLITVDLGITDIAEVDHANSLSIDVIITDHHLPSFHGLPKAFAILDSKQEGDSYPDRMLCGSGVAFKLIQGLIKIGNFDIPLGWEKWLLDMVGLATLADMVPLVNENRVFAKFGLKVLRKTNRPGLRSLFQKMKMNVDTVSEEDITFMIAPRINAASRMDDPRIAYELLSTKDHKKGREYADFLSSINDKRKILVASVVKEAKHTLSMREEKDVIVIGNPKWRLGILGLVAGKIMEEHNKTVFVWGSEDGKTLKGSCRTPGDVSLVELMGHGVQEVFMDFGGHEMAGGFSISHEKVHFLEEKLIDSYKKLKKDNKIDQLEAHLDGELQLEEVNNKTYEDILLLAPFGLANPRPSFIFKGLLIQEVNLFGKEKNHLQLTFEDKNKKLIKAIAFFKNKESFGFLLKSLMNIDLVATIECSYFLNKKEIRLRIVDCIQS